MSNGDEAMSPAEFAKLMGAYPEPSHNPLPAYGGYMDNSPANFAWVNNNAYFGAEGKKNCGCGQDPCITYGADSEDYVDYTMWLYRKSIPNNDDYGAYFHWEWEDEEDEEQVVKEWKELLHFAIRDYGDDLIRADLRKHYNYDDQGVSHNQDMLIEYEHGEDDIDELWWSSSAEDEYESMYSQLENKLMNMIDDGYQPSDIDLEEVVWEVHDPTSDSGSSGIFQMLMNDGAEMLRENETFDADTDLTPTNHMNNSIGQVVPITNPMELPTNLIETEAGGGPEGQITPDVFSADARELYRTDPQVLLELARKEGLECMYCDGSSFHNPYATPYSRAIGGATIYYPCDCGETQVVITDKKWGADFVVEMDTTSSAGFRLDPNRIEEWNKTDEELKEYALKEVRAGHGPDYWIETGEDMETLRITEMNREHPYEPETFEAESANRYWIKKVSFQGNGKMAYEAGGNPFYPGGLFTSAAAAKRDLQKMLEIAKDLPEVRISIGNQYYSNYQQPLADAVYHWRRFHEGTDHRTTHHAFTVWLPYGAYHITYEAVNKLGAETFESPDGYCPRCHVPGDRSTGRMELRCSDCGGGMFAETFEAPYGGAGALMDIGKETPLADFTGKELAESSAIHGDFDQASLNYSGHQNLEVRAEMEQLTKTIADVSNRFDESLGQIEVDDIDGDIDEIENVVLKIKDPMGDVVDEVTIDSDMIPDDWDDYYMAEGKIGTGVKLGLAGVVGVMLANYALPHAKKMFNSDTATATQDMLENDPELVENPNTGDLDPAQYEELVVESTGYAVDVIPMGLDGSFMGSRFQALPTERYVEYNEPGIGAHTDIALHRDEIYLEPEQAMVQASENVVKESQAPGQSPYNSITGEENPDFDFRVLKETRTVSLDPAVKPFIPQSMAGYTGNANTPPSVLNKMFNIGVLGQTPLFVAGQGDMGSSHTGSRNAIPDSLGIAGSVGGPLSDQVNANYTDGTTSMSLAQWSIENTVSQTSDTEAVVIDRSSGMMKRIRRV